MVKRLDEALGRLHDAIKSLGLSEDTIVLYTTDHGNHFKTRNAEYKRSCHESSVRLPTAISGPGFDGKGRIEQLVSLVDFPPTLLDAAGLPIPPSMEGRSVVPLVNGQTEGWPEEVFIQISESQVGRAIRTSRWKYGVDAPDKHAWNDAGSDVYVEQYLYDLDSDPYELQNLIEVDACRGVADALRDRLIARMMAAGEAAPRIESPPNYPQGQRAVDIDAVRTRYLKSEIAAKVNALRN
jgi:arylsulfatase A-like enzyme